MALQSLSNIRVIDLSHVIAGPTSSMYLAELGADVLKVENPRAPDVMRFVERRGENVASTTFATLNAGKKSLAMDLKHPRLRAALLDLIRTADVFIENFRPGVAERLGLGYQALRAVNSRLIYLSISGHGNTSAWRSHGAYDHVVQALTGMMMVNGEEADPPSKVGFPVIDSATGMMGAMAVLAALHQRMSSNEGCHVNASLSHSALQLMRPTVARVLASDQDDPRRGNFGFSGSPGSATFKCKDGWIAVAANTRAQFIKLCAALGLDSLPANPALVSAVGHGTSTNVAAVDPGEVHRLLTKAFSRRSATLLEDELNESGVPAARVRGLREFLREARINQHVDLGAGKVGDAAEGVPRLGTGLTGLVQLSLPPAPVLGADTETVLRSVGFQIDEISALEREGSIVVARAPSTATEVLKSK